MSRLILFDGGRAGGLLLDAGTVRTLAPFDAPLLANLAAVGALLRAGAGADDPTELTALATKAANAAVQSIEAAAGTLDANESLVWIDGAAGFVCGASGAPPRAFDWPPRAGAGAGVLATHILPPDLIGFLARTSTEGIKLTETLEDPAGVARRLNAPLSALDAEALRALAPSQLPHVTDPVQREVLGFVHAVIDDGRHLERWSVQPAAVAKDLNVGLSDAAVDRILGAGALVGAPVNVARLSISQGIVVGVVAVALLLTKPNLADYVIDNSGNAKF